MPRRDKRPRTTAGFRDGGAPVDLYASFGKQRRLAAQIFCDGGQFGVGETNPPRDTPERALMRAVLEDAARCYLERNKNPLAGYHAEMWFRSTAAGYLYDFERVCIILGIDASWFRRKLMGTTRKTVGQWRRGLRHTVRIDARAPRERR